MTLRAIAPDTDIDGNFEFPGVVFDDALDINSGLLDDDAWSANYVEFF